MANLHGKPSFLGLPRELRDQIYQYCVAVPADTSPPQYTVKPSQMASMGLLRVCKEIHKEAAIIIYGSNSHCFFVGWRSIPRNFGYAPYVYADTTTYLAPQYLRLVKSCVLFVNPLLVGCGASRVKSRYLKIKESVQQFANLLGGRHSLKELQISCDFGEENPFSNFDEEKALSNLFIPTPMPMPELMPLDTYNFICADTRLNLLEPLTDIYGVPRVSVSGVCPDVAYRLEQAMSCSQKAVSPIQEIYKTRMVKVKGQRGKKKQSYCVSKYYESKVVWNTKLLDTLPS